MLSKPLFIVTGLLFPICAKAATINLLEAIKTNRISVTITGNKSVANPQGSSHTGKCLLLSIKNKSSEKIDLKVEAAYQFINQTKANQDLISTETLIVSVGGQQTKEFAINALCSEKSNASPSPADTFILTKKHDAVISNLAGIFEKYKCYLNTAQQALWCFTDNNPIANIYDTNADTVVENRLVAYISTVKGIPIPARTFYVNTPRIIKYPLEVDSSVSVRIESITTIGIFITDSSHNILTTLIEDDTERRIGNAKYSYFYRGQYPKGQYYVAMRKNGIWYNLQTLILGE